MISSTRQREAWIRAVVLLFLAIAFVYIFSPFWKPILLAIFFAFGFEALLDRIGLRTGVRRELLALASLGALFGIFALPLTVIGIRAAQGAQNLSLETMASSQLGQSAMAAWQKAHDWALQFSTTWSLGTDVLPSSEKVFSTVAPRLVQAASSTLSSLPQLMLSTTVFFLVLFVLITKSESIRQRVNALSLLPPEEINPLIRDLKGSCSLILGSILFLGSLQAFVVATGASLLGFHEFLLIFSITFVLSFLPVIGAAPVAVFLSLLGFFSSDWLAGFGMLGVAAVVGSLDNLLKPVLISQSSVRIHPVISLLGMIGAILTLGIAGLLLGPLLLQITVQTWPRLSRSLLQSRRN